MEIVDVLEPFAFGSAFKWVFDVVEVCNQSMSAIVFVRSRYKLIDHFHRSTTLKLGVLRELVDNDTLGKSSGNLM